MIYLLIVYLVCLALYIRNEHVSQNLQITLAIDREYSKRATHAAYYGKSGDWNEVMDACSYFWSARE